MGQNKHQRKSRQSREKIVLPKETRRPLFYTRGDSDAIISRIAKYLKAVNFFLSF